MIYVDETDEKSVSDIELVFEPRNVKIKAGKDVKQEYTFHEELGRGKFGRVFRCTERCSGRRLAAKIVSAGHAEERRRAQEEALLMLRLQHPRLLQLYDAFDDVSSFCLVLELVEGGELFERVIGVDFVLTEKACACFVRQVCEGLQHMHLQRILHLDLKPENILCVSRAGNQVKIIDFGLARVFDPSKKLQVLFGTPEFVSPEVVNFDRVTPAADMWSLGVVAYVLLSGLSPFMGDSDLETMSNVTRAHVDLEDEVFESVTPDAKHFVSALLLKDPAMRMSASKCLQHPWLKKGEPKKETKLDTKRLKRFVIRRRWQKAVNALLALKAMGATI